MWCKLRLDDGICAWGNFQFVSKVNEWTILSQKIILKKDDYITSVPLLSYIELNGQWEVEYEFAMSAEEWKLFIDIMIEEIPAKDRLEHIIDINLEDC